MDELSCSLIAWLISLFLGLFIGMAAMLTFDLGPMAGGFIAAVATIFFRVVVCNPR